MALSLTTLLMYAQEWTSKDSLHVKKLLDGERELILNPDAVKSIDFGNAAGTPRISKEKSWMHFDESLPRVLPKPKVVLTLSPYTATTPYDWDPVYQKKIQVGKDTWRGDPFYRIKTFRGYTNTSKAPLRVMVITQPSLTEIEAIKLQYKPLFGQSNGSMAGVAIGGFNFMYVFTKDFWDKKGRERRARTLEVLKTYGDSTTVLVPKPILQFITH